MMLTIAIVFSILIAPLAGGVALPFVRDDVGRTRAARILGFGPAVLLALTMALVSAAGGDVSSALIAGALLALAAVAAILGVAIDREAASFRKDHKKKSVGDTFK